MSDSLDIIVKSARAAAEGLRRQGAMEDNEWPEPDEFCQTAGGDASRAIAQLLEVCADALALEHGHVAALEAALRNLRDYFAYGQKEHTGMSAGATPRCTPSVWKEIKRQVDEALRAK